MAHTLAVDRLRGPLTEPGAPRFKPAGNIPDRRELAAEIRRLFDKDWRNIMQGIYRQPADLERNPVKLVTRSLKFLQDVPAVDKRRQRKGHSEVKEAGQGGAYPRYYLQNFHYQTDGWLSEKSAKLYDTQVEVLFSGTAAAMRRQALVPLSEALKGRDQRHSQLLDMACGTGSFLAQVKENYPRLNVTALDLSPAYLNAARKSLKPWRAVDFVQAAAEKTGLETASQDVVTCVYLFHELPPKVRRAVAAEIARVLKPGGTFILVDALQTGDRADLDGLLEFFPVGFHEPYFTSYLTEDFARLFAKHGLTAVHNDQAFLSKIVAFRKAAD